jgi:hypothetical protein
MIADSPATWDRGGYSRGFADGMGQAIERIREIFKLNNIAFDQVVEHYIATGKREGS